MCRRQGLTLRGQGQTLSFYFNFQVINYIPGVGWGARCTRTLCADSAGGVYEMYICKINASACVSYGGLPVPFSPFQLSPEILP